MLVRVEGPGSGGLDVIDGEPEREEPPRPPVQVEPMYLEPPDEDRQRLLKILKLGAAALLIIGGLVLTVVGAQARLAAPLVWGAGVGAALALWEVVPPALEASAWVVSGVAGAILLVLGASWDRRLSEARQVADYVRRLR